MAGKRTVFIVGAGASAEFGFPVGAGLAENIRTTLSRTVQYKGSDWPHDPKKGIEHWVHRLVQTGGPDYDDVARAVRLVARGMSLAPSIDVFVHNHSDDQVVAAVSKIAIAWEILKTERSPNLEPDRQLDLKLMCDQDEFLKLHYRQTWLGQLWQLIVSAGKKADVEQLLSRIDFVVFNYDRCIEQFFYYALKHYFSLEHEEASRLFRLLTIVHVYGQVGQFPPTARSGRPACHYGEARPEYMETAVDSQLMTFSEAQNPLINEHRLASSMIRHADTIVFLGFQYGIQNMSLLFPAEAANVSPRRPAFGTCLGMAKPAIDEVDQFLSQQGINASLEGIKAHQLIQTYGQAMFR